MKTEANKSIGSTYVIHQNNKDAESAKIKAQIAEFKAKGGIIQKLAHGEQSEFAGNKKLSLRESKALAAKENNRMFEKRKKDAQPLT